MTANDKVMERLQTALSMELAAIHQYLLHAHVAEEWGLDKLASKMREEMQEELGHAEAFTRRIMFLKGDPDIKAQHPPKRARNLRELFEGDLVDEQDSIKFYTEASKDADAVGDIGTRDLFERIALDEEGHMAWLELQLGLIERLGEPMYQSMQINPQSAAETA